MTEQKSWNKPKPRNWKISTIKQNTGKKTLVDESPCSFIGWINNKKMVIIQKVIYGFYVISIKISVLFLIGIKIILNTYMEA